MATLPEPTHVLTCPLCGQAWDRRQAARRFLTASAVVLLAGVTGLILLLWPSADDILRAYPSPERHEGVVEVPSRVMGAETEHGDFDGDGILDELEVEYFNMEPLFRPSTSGMVYVRSGRTGATLLAHAVPSPFSRASWRGDLDGNGTDDVLVVNAEDRIALGFVRRR